MNDPITYFQAIVLGILQGLTEFLPISSSAHLLIFSTLSGWGDPGAAFTAVTQLGTEAAVLVYFRKDIWRIISTWTQSLYTPALRSNIDARMGWYVIVGTIPIGIFGYTFKDQIETAARNLWLVATVLIVFGIVLGIADRYGKQDKTLDDLNARTGLTFGFGQALALIPGVSRSGATISTGRVLGFDRQSATRYSFLLAIPAVLISGLFQALQIGEDPNVSWGPTIAGTVVAFFVGWSVIAWLLRYVSHGSFLPFVIYRIALGTIVLGLLATGVISA